MRGQRDRGGGRRRKTNGQALVELAIVLPILLVLTGGIIQIGTVIATKHTLIQIGRDVGRWAATQPVDPCTDLALANQPAVRAEEIAVQSGLMGYTAGTWTSAFTSYGSGPMPSAAPIAPGVEVAWELDADGNCPPVDSTTSAFVTIRLAHAAPVLLPGFDLLLAQLPGLGTCASGTCYLLVTTTAQFRMEPEAQPFETSP
jgi:TadE-like protein